MSKGPIIRKRKASSDSAPDTDVPKAAINRAHSASKQIANRTNEPLAGETFGTEFLDNLAHQLIAPLQSIERHCANIRDGRITGEDATRRLGEVIGHTRVLSELARRMRFLHQLVNGYSIGREQVEFSSIVTAWIDIFNNYLFALRDMGVESQIDLEMNKLPDIYASRIAVYQVVMNLYDNAMKYGKEGTDIRVFARAEDGFIINTFQHIAKVKLTEDAAHKIFDRGFRAKEAKEARAAGTGLGMWISRELMHAMGGNLRAFPTNKRGITKFELKWKVAV